MRATIWRSTLEFLLVCTLQPMACQRSADTPCDPAVPYAWQALETPLAPPARFDQAMAADPTGKKIYLFGGRSEKGPLSDLWVLDLTTLRWEKKDSTGGPPPRSGHSLIKDPDQDRLILFGGYPEAPYGDVKFLNDLWTWTPQQGWSREFVENTPPGRSWHGAGVQGQQMVIYGGYGDPPSYYLGDFWTLNLADLSFQKHPLERGPAMAGFNGILGLGAPSRWLLLTKEIRARTTVARGWLLSEGSAQLTAVVLGNALRPLDFQSVTVNPWEQTALLLSKAIDRYDPSKSHPWGIAIFRAPERNYCGLTLADGPRFAQGMICAPDPSRTSAWVCFGGVEKNRVQNGTWRLGPTSPRRSP